MPGVHVFLQFKILQFIVKFLHFSWFVFQRKKEKERTIAPILWCGSKITPQTFPLTHSLKEACRSISGGQPNTHFGRCTFQDAHEVWGSLWEQQSFLSDTGWFLTQEQRYQTVTQNFHWINDLQVLILKSQRMKFMGDELYK